VLDRYGAYRREGSSWRYLLLVVSIEMASFFHRVARKNLFIFPHHRRAPGTPGGDAWRGKNDGWNVFSTPVDTKGGARFFWSYK